jgi:hypothetical protein
MRRLQKKAAVGALFPLPAALRELMRMRCVLHALHYRKFPEALCSGQVKVFVHFGYTVAALTDCNCVAGRT